MLAKKTRREYNAKFYFYIYTIFMRFSLRTVASCSPPRKPSNIEIIWCDFVLRAPATSLSSRMRLCELAAMLRFIDAPPTSPSHTFTCFARMCLHVRMWVVFNTDTQVWGRMGGILLSCNSRQWIYIHKYTRSVGDFYAVSEHLKSMKHVHRCLYMYTYIENSALISTFCITSTTPNMWLLFPLNVRSKRIHDTSYSSVKRKIDATP